MKTKITFLTAMLSIFFAALTMAQVPSYVPTNGLVGYWPFNGNANDVSGNGNNGTVNGATLTTDMYGQSNSAYSFDGTSNYIEVPNSNNLNPTQITINVWINFPTSTTNSRQILSKLQHSNAYNFSYNIGLTPSKYLNTGWSYVGCSTAGSGGTGYVDSTILNPNSWIMITQTITSSGVCKYYLNGQLTKTFISGQIFNPCNNSLSTLRFGQWWNSGNQWWDGILDDIGIWNRTLTQQEITALFQGCTLFVNSNPINQSVITGNSAEFVTVSSDSNATYQWQTNTGSGFLNLTNAGQYNGVANDTLIVSNTTVANNNQQFRCVISAGSCVDTTLSATLSACPIISLQPYNQNVNIGNTALFIAKYSDPSATYQWQTDLGFGFQNITNALQYSGVTNDTLTVSNTILINNNQQFRCIVISGTCKDTTNVATLFVSLGINDLDNKNNFLIYPNPANNEINVEINQNLIGSAYTITDQIGKIVLSGKLATENTTIQLGNLSGGIYLFNIGNNAKQTFKVLK
ncbi:MAG: LamG-like jellyroll fold domain-containing protein, partial [Bacteroidales bacterium]